MKRVISLIVMLMLFICGCAPQQTAVLATDSTPSAAVRQSGTLTAPSITPSPSALPTPPARQYPTHVYDAESVRGYISYMAIDGRMFLTVGDGYTDSIAYPAYSYGWFGADDTHPLVYDGEQGCYELCFPAGVKLVYAYEGYAIDEHGRVWSWGPDYGSRLLDATANMQIGPYDCRYRVVPGLTELPQNVRFKEIHEGIALDDQGRVWTFGYNFYGNVGDGTYDAVESISGIGSADRDGIFVPRKPAPLSFPEDVFIVDIASPSKLAGSFDAPTNSGCMALDSEGRVWTWGFQRFWEMWYDVPLTSPDYAPELVAFEKRIISISCGEGALCAVDEDGDVWLWGPYVNVPGEENLLRGSDSPRKLIMPEGIRMENTAVRRDLVLAVDEEGDIWGWEKREKEGLDARREADGHDFVPITEEEMLQPRVILRTDEITIDSIAPNSLIDSAGDIWFCFLDIVFPIPILSRADLSSTYFGSGDRVLGSPCAP